MSDTAVAMLLNPPSATSSTRTRNAIARAGEVLGYSHVQIVNLFPEATRSVIELNLTHSPPRVARSTSRDHCMLRPPRHLRLNPRALTSGGSSGLRTRHTLLKRQFGAPADRLLTPGIRHVQARARTYLVGWVAAQRCCSEGNRAHLADALETLHDSGAVAAPALHLGCYPYTLLPTDATNHR